MDDLIAIFVVGRTTGESDPDGRQVVEPETDTAEMTLDGLLRRIRSTLLEEDVVALTVQIGGYDHVSESIRSQAHL
jgi:hypothetical protein